MFTARRAIPSNRIYSRDTLEKLGLDLRDAGFDEITVKLPRNLVQGERQVPLEDFMERERNYPAVIVSAASTERHEAIKFLFVNISSKTFFDDDTFPSGHSEPSELFVQSPDPARVYSLAGFFGEYFKKRGKSSRTALQLLAYVGALSLLVAQILSLMKRTGFFTAVCTSLGVGPFLDLASSVVALVVVFTFFKAPAGLYVKPPPQTKVWTLANRAVKGELRDNPLVSLVVTIVGGLIVACLAKLLGLL